jgi:Rps23 Pro-64 3,4-dihydroxylase Tpa1-like proline 4-hydroxylase
MDADKLNYKEIVDALDIQLLKRLENQPAGIKNQWLLCDLYRRQGKIENAIKSLQYLMDFSSEKERASVLFAILAGADLPESTRTDFAYFYRIMDFLPATHCGQLLQYAIARENDFDEAGLDMARTINHDIRYTLKLDDIGPEGAFLKKQLVQCLPRVLPHLSLKSLDIDKMSLKITAMPNGGFFQAHKDSDSEAFSTRKVNFVYYFHQEPKAYKGGDLLIYDTTQNYDLKSFTRLTPVNNSLVFFLSDTIHEVTPVIIESDDFRASRFTITGHICSRS